MKLLLFRTDIKTKKKVKTIKHLLNNDTSITNWSIDTEDIDNVLRIEATENLYEKEVINMIKINGFYCEALED